MRYALVSDIHANLQAWNAVLLDIRSRKIDRIICLGDIVGYGPDPARVLESVHANIDHLVLGNHDAVLCGKMDASLFGEAPRKIIDWTRGQLTQDAVTFLRSFPLTLRAPGFRCAHGEFGDPGSFEYIIDPEDAVPSWNSVEEQLLFVGHTHRPAIFLLGSSGAPHMVTAQDFVVEAGKRYIVNVGSVGQPRDGEARAAYCVLDADKRAVYWHRVPFDIDAYRESLSAAGLPAGPSYFLRHDPRKGRPPLRELLSFSPARTPEQAARDTVAVAEISQLRRRVTRWKILVGLLAALFVLAAATTAFALWRHAHRGYCIAWPGTIPLRAAATAVDHNILPSIRAPSGTGRPVKGWQVHLGHRRKQQVWATRASGSNIVLQLLSATGRDELKLVSPRVHVTPGMKLCIEGAFRKRTDFTGNTALVVRLHKQVGGQVVHVDPFIVKQPSMARRGGWLLAKQTFEVPADTVSLTFEVRSSFTGHLQIKDLSLVRRN